MYIVHPRILARVAREGWSTPWTIGPERKSSGTLVDITGHRTRPRVAWESCSTPQALEHGPRYHETCGRACGPSELGASPPGQLVDSAGHRTQPRLPGRAGQPRGPSDTSASRLLRFCRTSDLGLSRPGRLVDTAVPATRAEFAWESWSISRALGHRPKLTWISGRPRVPSDQGPSHLGQLVDSAVPGTRA